MSLVSGVAVKNVNLPILNNVLIKIKDQKAELVSTNLELAIISRLRAKIEEEGSFTVPAKTLYDFINLLSGENVELSVDKNELVVNCDGSVTKIKGAPAEEFPIIPDIKDGSGYLVDSGLLKKSLEQTNSSAAKNDIRPELSGVLFEFNGSVEGFLTMAATDSYRLSEKRIKLEQGTDKKKIIIPYRTSQEINRVLSLVKNYETEKNARVMVAENQMVVRYGGVELVSRLVEGQYPDYGQIIPTDFKSKACFEVNQMVKEVKAAGLFSSEGVNSVNFVLDPSEGKIVVSSESSQKGEYKSEVKSEMQGVKETIVLNYRYLLEGLGNIEGDEAVLNVVNGDSPCVLKSKEDDGYLYIIMPIRQ